MKRGTCLRWFAAGLLLVIIGCALGFFGAGNFLAAPAEAPVKADLMVALGGDNGSRADRVLHLYQEGFAPRVLLTGPEGGHSRTRAAYLHRRARYLIDEGVPETAVPFDRQSASSWDEAVNTLQLMRSMKLERVLVISDPPHMRRLSWVWAKVFAGSGKTYTLVTSDLENWDADRWWRTSLNAQFVFAEIIKLAYYLIQY